MTFEQIKGWGWQPLHDPALLPQVMAKWKGCIASGEPFEMVFPLKRSDGVFRRFLTRSCQLQSVRRGRALVRY